MKILHCQIFTGLLSHPHVYEFNILKPCGFFTYHQV